MNMLPMNLLRRIELYLARSGTAAARFGRDALGDPRFVWDLRNGRQLRARTVQRVSSYLDAREIGASAERAQID
ncbi:MAG: hypothetical protein JWN69_926 [Alphaproteobacteria bacterium]|nr:hypothetical protein [Alphaproteobacteria bacterium]